MTLLADAPQRSPVGLTSARAAALLAEVGPNRLAESRPRPAWRGFVDQFRNPLVAVLLGAVVLAAAVGDGKDAAVIGAIVVLNAALGYAQERKAERSLDALKRMLVTAARVRRDGAVTIIDAADLVPGDVVVIDAGDRVPADGQWLTAYDLAAEEAALTGESEPTTKRVGDPGFMNTVATRGRGELLVTETGMSTRVGRVADLLRTAPPVVTPLQRQLDGLARRLLVIALAAVVAVFAIGMARGGSLSEEVLSAVALAAGAIPEGLPAVVTVTLALGTRHLARRGAIVKRLASVETLGSTTVICSDKTGTLTVNAMTVRAVVVGGGDILVTGEGYDPVGTLETAEDGPPPDVDELATALALCNDSHVNDGAAIGDPMEASLLVFAAKAGVNASELTHRLPRLAEIPFDSARKYMATFHREGTSVRVFVKGAPDVLAALADLDAEGRRQLAADVERLAARGLRTLAAATTVLPTASFDTSKLETNLEGLRLLGLVGILDPPRPEARDAIALCRRAGIAVKMITGDHAATARVIAQDLGIDGETVTGADLDEMTDGELRERVDRIAVFARVAPEHKVRIVEALRANGEVVAMTGDGVNDAPALKRADIGLSMGDTGTEVAKEAATMVLTDDNFATIVAAVHRGRGIFENIVKFVRFQITTNVAAVLVLLTAAAFGLPRPFTAIHLLWVNLITDGPPGVALGVDPPAPDAMTRSPRRPGSPILSTSRLRVIALHAAVMAVGTLAVFWWAGLNTERATTLAFTTFVLFQVVNALSVRAEHDSVVGRHTLTNVRLWIALAFVVGTQVAAVHLPALHGVFDTTSLRPTDWAVVASVAVTVGVVEEVRIALARRHHPDLEL